MKNFLLSIIVPVYNEEKNIEPLLGRLLPVISRYTYEVIFVNDGSKDNTVANIKKATQKNPNIKLLSLARNFGHQSAITCGYHYAKGDCVVSIDADLQDPPETIVDMVAEWEKGKKIVYAKRKKRDVDSPFKLFTAKLFYTFINFLSDTPIPTDVGDFRLLDQSVVSFINKLPEQARFMRGLVAWGGFPSSYVYFVREKRFSGTTHYPFSKMLNFALEGITSFSTKPLRIASYFGFFTAVVGFIGIVYAVVGKIFLSSQWVTGWTALFVGIMFLGGVQLTTIGIIGEYIAKIYREVQHRPQYVVGEAVNI